MRYEPLTSQHRKASNVQLEPWPLTNIKPLHPPIPTILLSPILYPLCESNISPQVKSQIGKQLRGLNKPRLDFSTDLFVMPTKEGYIKIANMLGDIADARTPWMVDILVCSTDVDCNNRFCRPPSLFSYHPPSYAQHASSFVPYR